MVSGDFSLKSPSKQMKKLTEKKIERIKELHKKGLSERVIAKKIGCARSTVWYHLQK